MLGRIIGRLVVCEPAHQSLTELSDYLGASKGTLSPITRQLMQSGLLVKVKLPGDRSTYYRLRDNPWVSLMQARVTYTQMMRETAEKGLELVDEDSSAHGRVTELVEFYSFFENAMPAMLEGWMQRREDR